MLSKGSLASHSNSMSSQTASRSHLLDCSVSWNIPSSLLMGWKARGFHIKMAWHLSNLVRCFPAIILAAGNSSRRSRTFLIIFVYIPARNLMSAPSKAAIKPTHKSQISRSMSISTRGTQSNWSVLHARRGLRESTFLIILKSAQHKLQRSRIAAALNQKL